MDSSGSDIIFVCIYIYVGERVFNSLWLHSGECRRGHLLSLGVSQLPPVRVVSAELELESEKNYKLFSFIHTRSDFVCLLICSQRAYFWDLSQEYFIGAVDNAGKSW